MHGIGVSGMGRIGRLLVRKLMQYPDVHLKAINSIHPIETIAHLLKYDTVHGIWDLPVSVKDGRLHINGHMIDVVMERNPEHIPWKELGVDLVIDATGKFNYRAGAEKHLIGGASRVIITAPGENMDMTIVMGVNDHLLDTTKHVLLSAASCTTNCLAPVLNILDRAFQVSSGWMTTIHSFTSDQMHLDNPHKDLRRARACAQSIIPTSSGVGKALKGVLPHLAPHIHGVAVRVPTQDVSLIDLTVKVSAKVRLEEVRNVLRQAAEGEWPAYVGYSDEPLVSIDFVGNEKSATIDGLSIMAVEDQIKVLAWYDNEWGYVCRVAELAYKVHERMESTWEEAVLR